MPRPAFAASQAPAPAPRRSARARHLLGAALALLLLTAGAPLARATATANSGIVAVPAPGPLAIDGDPKDWDLSAGMLVCGNVEDEINKRSAWVHLMHDAKALYVLVRWTDDTPFNNPIPITNDEGWRGDCIQLRLLVLPPGYDPESSVNMTNDIEQIKGGPRVVLPSNLQTPIAKIDNKPPPQIYVNEQLRTHLTAWRHRAGKTRALLQFTSSFQTRGEVPEPDMAFKRYSGNDGYFQEIALPWSSLGLKAAPAADTVWLSTVQLHFTTDQAKQFTLNDLYRTEQNVNRNSIWQMPPAWGQLRFARAPMAEPLPVTLETKRTFKINLQGGVPIVDWEGFTVQRAPTGLIRAEDVPKDRRGEIEAAIRGLGAPAYAERQAATEQLRTFGVEALPFLEAAQADPDPEIRLSVRSLLNGK